MVMLHHTQKMLSPLLRKILFCFFGIASLAVILGCLLNIQGHKYSYIAKGSSTCSRNVITLDQPGSQLCCDAHFHSSDWVCQAVFDTSSRFLSSAWAWLLPVLPAALTALLDVFLVLIIPAKPKSTVLDIPSEISWFRKLQLSLPSLHLQRFGVYALIIITRVVLLYLVPEKLVGVLYALGWLRSSQHCWAPELVSANKCEMRFDFSDHIVLVLVQYLLPLSLELAFLCFNRLDADLTQLGKWRMLYYMPAAVAVCLFVLCVRAVFFTALFFHTPAECIVGLALSLAVVYVFVMNVPMSRRHMLS